MAAPCACAACNKKLRARHQPVNRDDLIEIVLDCLLSQPAPGATPEDEDAQEGEARAWAEKVVDATLYGSPQELIELRPLAPPWADEFSIGDAGNDLLVAAAQSNRPGTVAPLVRDYGAATNYISLDAPSEFAPLGTALHHAASLGHLGVVRALLEAGASPHEVDGTTAKCLPIHVAVMSDRAAVIEALLEAGADPNTEDATGASPFWLAASYNALESLPVLARAGADVFALNSKEQTGPEAAARTHGYTQAAELVRRLQTRQRMLEKKEQRRKGGDEGAAAAADDDLQQKQAEADRAMAELLQELEGASVSDSKARSSSGPSKAAAKRQRQKRRGAAAAAGSDNASNGSNGRRRGGDRSTITSVLQSLSVESSAASMGGIDRASPTKMIKDGGMIASLAAVLQPQSPGVVALGADSRKQEVEQQQQDGEGKQRPRSSAKAAPAAVKEQEQEQQQPAPAASAPPDPLAELRAEWDDLVGRLAAEKDASRREELAAQVRERMDSVAEAGVSVKFAKKVLGKLEKAARALAVLQAVMAAERLDTQALEEAVEAARPFRALLPDGALDAPEAELTAWQAQRDSLPEDLLDAPSPPRPLRPPSREAGLAPAPAGPLDFRLGPGPAGLLDYGQRQQQHVAALSPQAAGPPGYTPQQQQYGQQQQQQRIPQHQQPHSPGEEHGLTPENECVVCLAARRSALCVPCGHACVCLNCMPIVEQHNQCPLCRAPLEAIMPVFF